MGAIQEFLSKKWKEKFFEVHDEKPAPIGGFSTPWPSFPRFGNCRNVEAKIGRR
jgi:hypothetical protein